MTNDLCYGELCQPEDNSNARVWLVLGIVVAVLIALAVMNSGSFTGTEMLDDPSFLGY